MNRRRLDEMQVQKRSVIGSQTFIMLLYLLLLDILLNGFGFKWVGYPENVLLILTLCSGVYALRLILANAVVGPAAKSERLLLKAVLTVLPVIAVSAAAAFWVKDARFGVGEPQGDIRALLLFITSGAALFIAAAAFAVKMIQTRNEE